MHMNMEREFFIIGVGWYIWNASFGVLHRMDGVGDGLLSKSERTGWANWQWGM